jgi:hypothetical protein
LPRLNNIYSNVSVTHTATNSSTAVQIYSGSQDATPDLGQYLTGDNDSFTVYVTGDSPNTISRWQRQVGVLLQKNDDNPVINDDNIGCCGCHSADATRFRINRTSGQVTIDSLETDSR